MTRCKNCKNFDNTKPVSMARENDKYKSAEKYIGRCKLTGTVKMMNDQCYDEKNRRNENDKITGSRKTTR